MTNYDPRPRIAPWYWLVFACWAAAMLFAMLAILDYGMSTILPVETGWAGVLEWAIKLLLILLPVWTYPLARRRPRTS